MRVIHGGINKAVIRKDFEDRYCRARGKIIFGEYCGGVHRVVNQVTHLVRGQPLLCGGERFENGVSTFSRKLERFVKLGGTDGRVQDLVPYKRSFPIIK